jgi:hypothetical protein
MKSMQDLVSNMSMTESKEKEIVVDDFAKNVINKVFNELAVIFPAWKHAWPTDKELSMAKLQWTKAFVENNISTMEQISYGFAKARKSETDFLPSCGKFISWCEPSFDDLGYPSQSEALRKCISYRNATKLNLKPTYDHFIHELTNSIDWFLVSSVGNQAEAKKADEYFKVFYLKFITEYQKPEQGSHHQLETSEVVRERMSPQQLEDGRIRGLGVLSDIKNKLKHKG